jgi:hypothetical protein
LVILLEVQVEACNDQIFATSDRLDYLRGLNEVVRTVIGQELRARYSVPEKLPDALFTLINQLDDQQKQEC